MTERSTIQTPIRSYIICTTPRSGSTLLCKMLGAVRVAGNPDSHFHVPSFDVWLNFYGLSEARNTSRRKALVQVFNAAIERGKRNADVFGLRMQRASFNFFIRQLAVLSPQAVNDKDRIESVFGPTLFIHLSRKDKLDQAISFLRAEKTGLWHRRSDGSDLERRKPSGEAHYNRKEIAQKKAEFAE